MIANRQFTAAGFVLCAVALGCAGPKPLPPHLHVDSVAQLLDRMENVRVEVAGFVAEARMTYFGPDGRVRGTATVAIARPDRIRYEMHGPHGGVIEAFATNGVEMQLLALAEGRFLYGPATVENLDQLMSVAPMHLDPAGWVALLLGEMRIPGDAELVYDDRLGRFILAWPAAPNRVSVEVDPETARVARATVRRDGTVVSQVTVESRDDRGLPSELHLQVPAESVDLRLKLRDVTYDPDLPEDAFVLDPPRGVVPERIEAL